MRFSLIVDEGDKRVMELISEFCLLFFFQKKCAVTFSLRTFSSYYMFSLFFFVKMLTYIKNAKQNFLKLDSKSEKH